MWFVVLNRCWTADRLAKRNLPPPASRVLCDQEENINHILVGFVFVRQFWFFLLQRVGLSILAPQPAEASFDDWWRYAISLVPNTLKKGLDSHYFGSLTIWKHHNDRVFDGKSPSLSVALIMAGDELCFWNLAKAVLAFS